MSVGYLKLHSMGRCPGVDGITANIRTISIGENIYSGGSRGRKQVDFLVFVSNFCSHKIYMFSNQL